MSEDKQPFRLSLEARHENDSRVFSFKFPKNERAQAARRWLEQTEVNFYEDQKREVPLWEIIAAIAEELQYGKVSPFNTEKKMMHVIMKRLEGMQSMLQDIAEREPVVYAQASQAHTERTGESIDDDFIGSMLDDFNSMGRE